MEGCSNITQPVGALALLLAPQLPPNRPSIAHPPPSLSWRPREAACCAGHGKTALAGAAAHLISIICIICVICIFVCYIQIPSPPPLIPPSPSETLMELAGT